MPWMWQQQTKTELLQTAAIRQRASTYAPTSWHSRPYSFRSSRERTVSMTAPELSSVPVQKLSLRYSATFPQKTSAVLSMPLKKPSTRRRSSCSLADSPQVMSRMDQQNSLQPHSRMRRSKKLLPNCWMRETDLPLVSATDSRHWSNWDSFRTVRFSDRRRTPRLWPSTPSDAIFPRWFTRRLWPTNPHGWQAPSLAVFTPTRHPTERDVS